MPSPPTVLIFHRPLEPAASTLVQLLNRVRRQISDQQAELFGRLGASVRLSEEVAPSFGQLLARAASATEGLVVLSAGAVPRMNARDAQALVNVAASGEPLALTNNRYSSDICAIGDSSVLSDLPPLPSDNALPRWLEERAGFEVRQLGGRDRLALDIDSPLDVALWRLAPNAPRWVHSMADEHGVSVPHIEELRALVTDPRREVLIFGRAGSTTLRWLERNVRCRVRFLAEERGLRASSPLAIAGQPDTQAARPPRATLGRLLDHWGPEALGEVVAELSDGAIIDTRVLMADRFGSDEADWPPPADRFASDLLRPDQVGDGWLRALTESAVASNLPIVLGAHSLVGPGIPLLLRKAS